MKTTVVNTTRYTKETLATAVAAFNDRPTSGRCGEDMVMGYSSKNTMDKISTLDQSNVVARDIKLTIESDGTVSAELDLDPRFEKLASNYGIGFGIRGITDVTPNENRLVNIVAIDLVRYDELRSPKENVALVLEWSAARGILANGKVATQNSKFYEEMGELALGICKSKLPIVKDSIGDALVVLTNILGIAKRDLRDHLARVEGEYELMGAGETILSDDPHELLNIAFEHSTLVAQKFRLHRGSLAERLAKEDIHYYLLAMYDLAIVYKTTVDECLSAAYYEIKDRRGFLSADGVFVKEADAQ